MQLGTTSAFVVEINTCFLCRLCNVSAPWHNRCPKQRAAATQWVVTVTAQVSAIDPAALWLRERYPATRRAINSLTFMQ